jgi:hypothetical protein
VLLARCGKRKHVWVSGSSADGNNKGSGTKRRTGLFREHEGSHHLQHKKTKQKNELTSLHDEEGAKAVAEAIAIEATTAWNFMVGLFLGRTL